MPRTKRPTTEVNHMATPMPLLTVAKELLATQPRRPSKLPTVDEIIGMPFTMGGVVEQVVDVLIPHPTNPLLKTEVLDIDPGVPHHRAIGEHDKITLRAACSLAGGP